MPEPRIGALFAGYLGLDLAVQEVLGGDLAWVSENDKGACKIIAHRFPGVPNHGDIRRIDWSQVEPVDVLTAGFPCQPVSAAGKGAGLDDERWLFGEVVRALGDLDPRPRLLVLENVPRLLTIDRGNVMAHVVHGLASVGYVGRYRLLRASDVGAPHRRERVFFAAIPEDQRHEWGWSARGRRPGPADGRGGPVALLPTPRASDGTKGGPNQRGSSGDLMLPSAVAQRLLPTPQVADAMGGHLTRSGDRSGELLLPGVAKKLLPTPTSMDHKASGGDPTTSNVTLTDATTRGRVDWGEYAGAITRWEAITRPAPPPTVPGPKGKPRLNPAFSEWMMGVPADWVTDVPGITRNEALKAIGNGVCPQQAAAALRLMLPAQMGATA